MEDVMFQLPEFIFGIFETFSYIIDRLVFLVLVGLHGGGRGLKGSELRLVAERVQQLADGGQESGAVRLQLLVLLAQAELHGEPVYLSKDNIVYNPPPSGELMQQHC